jgi:two-component system chemotaxis response regulator CheB
VDKKIKILIVDDSALMRSIITRILGSDPGIEVVGTAMNGKFALTKMQSLNPDLLILDLEMPEMNGIEFLKEKNRMKNKLPVIILSAHAKKGAAITLEALSLGASDFVMKPSDQGENIETIGKKLLEMIYGLTGRVQTAPVITQNKPETRNPSTILSEEYSRKLDVKPLLKEIHTIQDIQIVAIGISTGGPNALRDILPRFPADFPVPIVIVQHMPAGFTAEFASSLDKICQLRVKEAEDQDLVKPGRILIAQGNRHLKLVKKSLAVAVSLTDTDQVNGHRPSCDVLFESVAQIYGPNAIGCIMTGMGKDGAAEIGSILNKGGITLAQDQETSVVFGMPKVAIEKGNIQIVKPLTEIPDTILSLVLNRRLP